MAIPAAARHTRRAQGRRGRWSGRVRERRDLRQVSITLSGRASSRRGLRQLSRILSPSLRLVLRLARLGVVARTRSLDSVAGLAGGYSGAVALSLSPSSSSSPAASSSCSESRSGQDQSSTAALLWPLLSRATCRSARSSSMSSSVRPGARYGRFDGPASGSDSEICLRSSLPALPGRGIQVSDRVQLFESS